MLVGFRNVVSVFLADSDKVLVENRYGNLGLGLLLDKTDYARSFREVLKLSALRLL